MKKVWAGTVHQKHVVKYLKFINRYKWRRSYKKKKSKNWWSKPWTPQVFDQDLRTQEWKSHDWVLQSYRPQMGFIGSLHHSWWVLVWKHHEKTSVKSGHDFTMKSLTMTLLDGWLWFWRTDKNKPLYSKWEQMDHKQIKDSGWQKNNHFSQLTLLRQICQWYF